VSDLFLTSFGIPDLIVDVVGDHTDLTILAPRGPQVNKPIRGLKVIKERQAHKAQLVQPDLRVLPGRPDPKAGGDRRANKVILAIQVPKVHKLRRELLAPPVRKVPRELAAQLDRLVRKVLRGVQGSQGRIGPIGPAAFTPRGDTEDTRDS
jgi:hypothetical protein